VQILGIGRLKTKLKMLLMQDRVLGETMMHLVPSCSPHPPTFDASQLDFDLDLLPGFNDCQVSCA